MFNEVLKPQSSGSVVTVSSSTFAFLPIILNLADDQTPFDSDEVNLLEYAMSLSGELVTWGKYVPISVTVGVVAISPSDIRLQALLDLQKPRLGTIPFLSNVSMSVLAPNGYTRSFTQGTIYAGKFAPAMNTNGRFDSRQYKFVFGTVI